MVTLTARHLPIAMYQHVTIHIISAKSRIWREGYLQRQVYSAKWDWSKGFPKGIFQHCVSNHNDWPPEWEDSWKSQN